MEEKNKDPKKNKKKSSRKLKKYKVDPKKGKPKNKKKSGPIRKDKIKLPRKPGNPSGSLPKRTQKYPSKPVTISVGISPKNPISNNLKNNTTLTKLETNSATINNQFPESKAPKIKNHLLKNPHVGGIPIIAKAPMTKNTIVIGIFLKIPFILSNELLPVL